MGTDRDAFYLDGWGYDRLQAQTNPKVGAAAFWATTARAAAFGANHSDLAIGAAGHTSETEEALREEIQAQAEVIEAQDWQIEALQEERDALLAELDAVGNPTD